MAAKRPLTTRQILAAHRLIEDRLTDREIAEECAVSETQLRRWKRNPQFRTLLKSLGKKFDAELVQVGIASKRGRLESMLDQHRRMQLIIDERATDPHMQNVPGGRSGLLVRQYKAVGPKIAVEYAFDAGLHREMRELKRQIAVECGQWVEKLAPTNPEGDREYGELTESERAGKLAQIFDSIRTRADRPATEGADEVGVESGPTN